MIRVEYGTAERGVKELFSPSADGVLTLSKPDDLAKNFTVFKNFANPCEPYGVLLDGNAQGIPEDLNGENVGVWSELISDEDGNLDVVPIVDFKSDEKVSVKGLTFTFDASNNVYPTEMSLLFTDGDLVLKDIKVKPDSTVFAITESVDGFDGLRVGFLKINSPNTRLKFRAIEYGVSFQVKGHQVKSVRVSQKIDPISSTLPISTGDLTILNNDGSDFSFQTRQNLRIYNNETLIGDFFVENAKKINKQQWNITLNDYISLLDGVDFPGGIYTSKNSNELISEIFATANVPCAVSDELKELTVTGYIPYTTCRKALQQVLIGIGAFANTSYSNAVNIEKVTDDVQEDIPLDRVMSGQKVTVDTEITEFELFAHHYSPIDNDIVLHKADEDAQGLRVIFNQPVHSLTITYGEIVESGTNYAIINCQAGAELKGKTYEHLTFSKVKRNENAKSRTSKRKSIKDATLVSKENLDSVLEMCYNYVVRSKSASSKIIEGDVPLQLGKTYSVNTETEGVITGTLLEQSFNLYGGKVVKQTTIR